jgi:hypothetical protein
LESHQHNLYVSESSFNVRILGDILELSKLLNKCIFPSSLGAMGCNNSHLRPFFRRCRRRRSKKDDSSVTPKGDYIEIERNGSGGDGDLSHGIQLLGASIRNANNKTADSTADSTFCVPLLAQA